MKIITIILMRVNTMPKNAVSLTPNDSPNVIRIITRNPSISKYSAKCKPAFRERFSLQNALIVPLKAVLM